jgi:hypothetical protein
MIAFMQRHGTRDNLSGGATPSNIANSLHPERLSNSLMQSALTQIAPWTLEASALERQPQTAPAVIDSRMVRTVPG